jgi:hypothetical protein
MNKAKKPLQKSPSRRNNLRKSLKRKTMKRKTMKRKTMKRKTMKRKTMKRKNNRKKSLKRKTLKRRSQRGGGGEARAAPAARVSSAEGFRAARVAAGKEPPDQDNSGGRSALMADARAFRARSVARLETRAREALKGLSNMQLMHLARSYPDIGETQIILKDTNGYGGRQIKDLEAQVVYSEEKINEILDDQDKYERSLFPELTNKEIIVNALLQKVTVEKIKKLQDSYKIARNLPDESLVSIAKEIEDISQVDLYVKDSQGASRIPVSDGNFDLGMQNDKVLTIGTIEEPTITRNQIILLLADKPSEVLENHATTAEFQMRQAEAFRKWEEGQGKNFPTPEEQAKKEQKYMELMASQGKKVVGPAARADAAPGDAG